MIFRHVSDTVSRFVVFSAVFSFALSFSAASSWAQKSSGGGDAESAAVKQVVAGFSDSFNRHDPHASAALFDEEGDFTNMRGASRHGRKDIEQNYATIYAGPLKEAHRVDTVKNVRFLSPDLAEIDATWEMTGTKAADGSSNPTRKGLLDWVLKKENGQWLIVVFHESEFPS